MKTRIITIILFLLGIGLFSSCSTESTVNLQDKPTNDTSKDILESGKMVLGKKLENPYSLKNMQNAVKLISRSKKRDALKGKESLKPTHIYVVFLPNNEKHMSILREFIDSEKYACREYPMDYEIIQHGSEYIDARTKDTAFPVLYASIPVADTMPEVPYEKLEDLYLTDDENDADEIIETTALFLAEEKGSEKLQTRGITNKEEAIKNYLNNDIQAFFGIFNRRYYPEGRVVVENTSTGSNEPLANASIQIYNWFFSEYCTTDRNGRFKCRSRFRREMGVYSSWRNTSVTIRTSWSEIVGIRVSDKLGNISRRTNGTTFYIKHTDKHEWKKAVVYNAVEKFNNYLQTIGIGERVRSLNAWVSFGPGRGAAPMLRRYSFGVVQNSLLVSYYRWLSPVTIPLSLVLDITSSQIYPDLFFSIRTSAKTMEIEQLVFHESAHAIHAEQAGREFWAKFVRRTVENIVSTEDDDPYGDGTSPSGWSGQNIALCEGWANFMENKVMYDLYHDSENNLEKFVMVTVPTKYKGIEEEGFPNMGRPWFLHGLMWDLVDIDEDPVKLLNGKNGENATDGDAIIDQVYIGRSVSDGVRLLFNALGSAQSTGGYLRDRLKRQHRLKAVEIEKLFKAYGY